MLEEGRAQRTSAAQACIAPLNLKEYDVVVVVVELQGVIHAEPYSHAVRVEHVTMSTRRVADAKVRRVFFRFVCKSDYERCSLQLQKTEGCQQAQVANSFHVCRPHKEEHAHRKPFLPWDPGGRPAVTKAHYRVFIDDSAFLQRSAT